MVLCTMLFFALVYLIENTIEQYKVGSVHLILAKILVCLDFDVV